MEPSVSAVINCQFGDIESEWIMFSTTRPEEVLLGNHMIGSLLFADDAVMLASSSQDFQRALGVVCSRV